MIDLVFAADDLDRIRRELTGGPVESCAVLYASPTRRTDGIIRLLVRETTFPDRSDYTQQGLLEAELSPMLVARVTRRARVEKYALVFVHSHPGDQAPEFSSVDCRGEHQLAEFLAHRHPDMPHAAVVVSLGGMRARRLGTDEDVRIIGVGTRRDVVFDPSDSSLAPSDVHDRQIRAFGASGQRALQRLRVAIVGLGGMGSLIAQQLAHLGVRDFVLVDPDTLERTNLNRVANATPADVGRAKVELAAEYIRRIAGGARVVCVQGDVISELNARRLLEADFMFGCTDSHGSRAVIQQVAYQYLIPCIDTGTTITVESGKVTHIYGRVQLLAPGLACLTCSGLLDAKQVRRDMMTPFERQADPYIQGAREPAPAVMSINATVGSLAVTMMLSTVCGVPSAGRYLLYNAMSSVLRSVRASPDPHCYICSHFGSFGRGDGWPLLTRKD